MQIRLHGRKASSLNITLKGRYTYLIYGPCSRPVNTGVTLHIREHGPCSQVPIHTTREHDPSTRPVNASKVKCLFVYHLIMNNSPLRRSGMARVMEDSHNFTSHPHVYSQLK